MSSSNRTRPLSPHLTIWRWGPLMAVTIMHRAAGVGMGTRFLLTRDSTVPDAVKAEYLRHDLTGRFFLRGRSTGRWAIGTSLVAPSK